MFLLIKNICFSGTIIDMPEMNSSLEQEIAQLEKQIAEKRAVLGQEQTGPELPPEKEIFHGIVGEKIQQHIPQYQPRQGGVKPKQDDGRTPSYADPELKDKIQELVNLVFNKSLEQGIKEVSRSNNPALIDAFHDVLVDELYNVLLERKKLEQIK